MEEINLHLKTYNIKQQVIFAKTMGGNSSSECQRYCWKGIDISEEAMIVQRNLAHREVLAAKQRTGFEGSNISNATTIYARQLFFIDQSLPVDKSKSTPSSSKSLSYVQSANHYYDRGNLQAAINNYMIGLHKIDRGDIRMAQINFAIAQCYFSLDNFKMAMKHCKIAEGKYSQLIGKYSQQVAMTCNLIGHIHNQICDYVLAQHYYQKAYKIFREKGDENYQNLMEVGFNLAALYLNVDKNDKSLEIYEQIQELIQNDPSYANNSTIMELYRCIGVNYFKLSLYEKSMQYFKKTFEYSLSLTMVKNHSAEKLCSSFKLVKEYLQSIPTLRRTSLISITIILYQKLRQKLT